MHQQKEEFAVVVTETDTEDLEASEQAIALAPRSDTSARVQAAFVIAKRFPRDQEAAITRIVSSCKREGVAKVAMYAYPRGFDPKTKKKNIVTGPSIRLAEVIAQAWGNLDFGVRELSTEGKGDAAASIVESYCTDLETNVHQTKVFKVFHKRWANGVARQLTDPRDIYEHVANHGARRMRACILGVVPKDIVDTAVEAAMTTQKMVLARDSLADRVNKLLSLFETVGVTADAIERYLGHSPYVITEDKGVELVAMYNSLKDGHSKREDFFPSTTKPSTEGAAAELTARTTKAKKVRQPKKSSAS